MFADPVRHDHWFSFIYTGAELKCSLASGPFPFSVPSLYAGRLASDRARPWYSSCPVQHGEIMRQSPEPRTLPRWRWRWNESGHTRACARVCVCARAQAHVRARGTCWCAFPYEFSHCISGPSWETSCSGICNWYMCISID